jgi:hypothetical protein
MVGFWIMSNDCKFVQDAAFRQISVFDAYVGQTKKFTYGFLAEITDIPQSTLRAYGGGMAMPYHVLIRLLQHLPPEAGNQLMAPSGYALRHIDVDKDDWTGIGKEAALLTFEIIEAQSDGFVDHVEVEKLKSRCRSLAAKAEGAFS